MSDNTYTYPKKEDLEIIVGDEKQENFYPRMKIKRWDNEVNFSIGVISAHAGTDSNITDKVEWDDEHGIKARFYEKEEDEFEFEIELTSKPTSNVLRLSIETKGLDFFYQPPLTEAELNDTILIEGEEVCRYNRPENIAGSYAVYHSTASGNIVGGNNYRAGKAFHIHRPYVTDSKGWRVWCDLHIDNDMMITIPQDFIDKSVYPIIIDPTFGCDPESPGGSTENNNVVNHILGSVFSCPSAGTGSKITVRIGAQGGRVARAAIYTHSTSGFLENSNTGGEITTSQGTHWYDFNLNPSVSLLATDYVLVAWGNTTTTNLSYDSGDTNQGHDDSETYGATFPATATFAHNNNKYSIYCTYSTPSVGIARSKIDGGLAGRGLINGGLIR